MRGMFAGGGVTRRGLMAFGGAGLLALGMAGRVRAQSAQARLRFALSTMPPSIRPWDNTGAAAGTVKVSIMRGLTGYDNQGELIAELAERWTQIDDKTLEFTLRDNALFHNGKPVTSADVEWSLKQILAEGSTAYLKNDLKVIDRVEIIDARVLRLHLKAPTATLVQVLADYNCPIVSAESSGDNFITAGPFVMDSEERGVSIKVKRFEGWHEAGKPGVAGIDFLVYSDENLRYAALEAGDVDLIEYVPWQSFDTADADPNIQLMSSLGPFMFLLFNVTKGPFADARVRQAAGFAIQRQDVVDAAFAGRGKPLTGFPNPPGSGFDIANPDFEYGFDPERAKALLAEAGYAGGFNCRLLATSTYGMHQDTASVTQAYLQMVGINAELVLPDWGTRVTAGTNGDYDIAVHGSAGYYNDPDSLYAMLHSGNPSYLQSYGFKSERIDDLLARGRAELERAKREAIYRDLARAYFEEAPQVPLNWRQQAYGAAANVQGFHNMPGFLTFSSPYCVEDVTLS